MMIFLIVFALVVALAWVCWPVTEQDVLEQLVGPEYKSANEVTALVWKSWPRRTIGLDYLLFRLNVLIRLCDLQRRNELAFMRASSETGTVAGFRKIIWDRLECNRVSQESFDFQDQAHPVWVLNPSYEPALRGFVGLLEGVILISSDVPRSDRPYYCLHEILCRPGLNGCCVAATETEIESVVEREGGEFLGGYLCRRLGFYDRLIDFYATKHALPEFIKRLQASRDRLLEDRLYFQC